MSAPPLVGYVRVSTGAQADRWGLPAQRAAVRRWAAHEGAQLRREFLVDVLSGTTDLESRPALVEGLRMVYAGEVAGIVVPELSRLARELVLQEQLLAEIRRAGGVLRSAVPAEDALVRDDQAAGDEDPQRVLVRHILGAVAQFERSVIRLRLRRGRAQKALAGGYAYGRPPYGWRADAGALVPVPAEQDTIRAIRRMRRDGSSLRAIADVLNEHVDYRDKGWHPQKVRRILTRAANSKKKVTA